MVRRSIDPNVDFPNRKIVWTVSLIDAISYKEECSNDSELKLDLERMYVSTGEVNWDVIKDECHISNAIDFIRETK